MIHHVWLINRAGICILDRDYTEFEVNKQLFTGFLTALSYLADQFNRKLDVISMGDMAIYYDLEENLIIALAVDRDDNEEEVRRKILEIREEFFLKFSNILVDWDGNLACFDPFSKELDRILMLDWNFEYDSRIKSKEMKSSYPSKGPVYLNKRGMDLFEAIRKKTEKTKK